MTRTATFVVVGVGVLLGIALACKPDDAPPTSSNEEGSGEGEEAGGAVDLPAQDVDLPAQDAESGPACEDGLDFCDGECVDLQISNDHCGRCEHECLGVSVVGPCDAGQCPARSLCGPSTDFTNCNDVCAAGEQTCVDGSTACAGRYSLSYGLNGVENCEAFRSGESTLDGSCADPIDWTHKGGLLLDLPVAVSCCCTQN